MLNSKESNDEVNDMVEASLVSIENLIYNCPNQSSQNLKMIFQISNTCLVYDPSFDYSAQDQNMNDGDDDEGWGDDGDDGGYEEDQDDINADQTTAWKIRKASLRVMDAIIMSCPIAIRDHWDNQMNLLSQRFIERDSGVKCDILRTFRKFIQSSVNQ